ncbi:hypothetical protein F2Q68_00009326 [Brassica cretica]|uniref:AMP-dependent synthetase/ligase domain-containing protein n=2 Tax=Brassica cretica TaxID=69181 RepID=A0ABQ7EC96_BRACR|nr:hypothetical protein F2Q68_00009326 [Brassica cretica]KAF3594629.1 hypothetical protein DY000_02022634 [Brassica cretica]
MLSRQQDTLFLTKKLDQEPCQDIIFRSKLPDIVIPNHLPLTDYVFQRFSGDGDSTATCLIDSATGRIFTYANVQINSQRVAAGIHRLGIRRRDTVMLLLPNSPEFAFSFLAVAYLGAVTTTANPLYTQAEIARQANASAANMIITKQCYVNKLIHLQNDGVLIVCVDDENGTVSLGEGCVSFTELTRADETELSKPEISPDDTVAIPYSSGTTGLPKGVMITHKGLVTSIAQKVDGENPNLNFTGDDVIICFLPMFHTYAFNALILSAMRTGAAVLIVPRFELTLVMELIQRYKVTVVPVVPPVVLAFVKSQETERYDLSSVRMMISGAATLRKELEEAVLLKFPNAIFGQVRLGYFLYKLSSSLSRKFSYFLYKLKCKK